MAPQGAVINSPRQRVDSTLVKAIARAYRWQRMLEEGTYSSLRDLAAAETHQPDLYLAPAAADAACTRNRRSGPGRTASPKRSLRNCCSSHCRTSGIGNNDGSIRQRDRAASGVSFACRHPKLFTKAVRQLTE